MYFLYLYINFYKENLGFNSKKRCLSYRSKSYLEIKLKIISLIIKKSCYFHENLNKI